MSQDLHFPEQRERLVDVSDLRDVREMARKFDVTANVVFYAVQRVGAQAADVEAFLEAWYPRHAER